MLVVVINYNRAAYIILINILLCIYAYNLHHDAPQDKAITKINRSRRKC